MSWNWNSLKVALGSMVLVGSLALLSVPAKADCYSSMRNKRIDLDNAIARHGAWSSQAAHERNELRQQGYRCGYGSGYGYGLSYRYNPGYGYSYGVPDYRNRDDRHRHDRDVYRDRDERRDHDRRREHDNDWGRDRDRDQR